MSTQKIIALFNHIYHSRRAANRWGGWKLLPCRCSSASGGPQRSRTCKEAKRLGSVSANCHVAPTPTGGFRAVNEDPRTVRPLTNAESIHRQGKALLDDPICDHPCDRIEVERIVAEVDKHTPITEA